MKKDIYPNGERKTMTADLHIHSTVSDSAKSIPEIIAMAEARGLDAIAITDHDTFSHIAQTL
jgi:predicted metal-dependent phosphoesterase TrpH